MWISWGFELQTNKEKTEKGSNDKKKKWWVREKGDGSRNQKKKKKKIKWKGK